MALMTVQELCVEQQITVEHLATQTGIDEWKVLAIFMGRWTPSPVERQKIAGFFSKTPDDFIWGHKTALLHIYGL